MYGYITLDWLGGSKEQKEYEKQEIIELAHDYHIHVWFSELNYKDYDSNTGDIVTYGTDDILMFCLKDTYRFVNFMTGYMRTNGQGDDIANIEEFICDNITVTPEEYTTDLPRNKYRGC